MPISDGLPLVAQNRQYRLVTGETATAEDYASIDRAAEELSARGWRRSFSPNAAVSGWASFVHSVERGYAMTIDDYTNDLSVRRWAEEARPYLTPLITKSMGERLKPLDDRFRAETIEAGKLPGAGEQHWWGTRLPRLLVGELAEDVARMGLGADGE